MTFSSLGIAPEFKRKGYGKSYWIIQYKKQLNSVAVRYL